MFCVNIIIEKKRKFPEINMLFLPSQINMFFLSNCVVLHWFNLMNKKS